MADDKTKDGPAESANTKDAAKDTGKGATRPAASSAPAPKLGRRADIGQKEVQEVVDEANAQGYFGTVPDPTPNEHYSQETPPDAPTPETMDVGPDGKRKPVTDALVTRGKTGRR